MNNVRRGNAMTHATTRGTTRNLNESIESDSMLSICSVARILASTAPIPEPTRPARSRPATSGPISTKNAKDWTVGIRAPAPKRNKRATSVKCHHGPQRESRGDDKRE